MKIISKLPLWFLVIGSLPMVVTGIFCYQIVERGWTANILAQLNGYAAVQEQHVHDLIRQNYERLALVSNRTQLRLTLRRFLSDPDEAHRARLNRILLDAQRSVTQFESISILNREGTVIASTDAQWIGVAVGDEECFQAALVTNRVDLLRLAANDQLRLWLCGPLQEAAETLGVIQIELRADDLLNVLQEHRGLGETGETMLVGRDEHGNALVLTPLRHDPGAALKRVIPKNSADSPITQSLRGGERAFIKATDYRGVTVMAVSRYLPEVQWGLIVKVDRAEAFAPLIRLRNLSFLALVVSLLFVAWIALRLARALTRPIARLTETAARISAGDLERRAAVDSSDELGILAQSFNEMASHLTAANRELEEKIDIRTAELQRQIAERREADQALAIEQKRLRTLIDNTPDLIYVKDIASRFVVANEAVARLFGAKTTDDVIGKTDHDFYPPDLADQYLADEQAILETGQPMLGKIQPSRNVDGEAQWLATNKTPLRDTTGKIIGLVGVAHNITQHRAAEDALHRSEAKFRLMVEQLPAIIYIAEFGSGGRWLYVSPQIESILGYTPEEWMNDPGLWAKSLHPADRKRVLDEEEHASLTREAFRAEYRLLTRAGNEIWVRDVATVAAERPGDPERLHGVLYDITSRRYAEEALSASEHYFHSVIDTARDAFVSINSASMVIDWNRQAETLFGWSHKEIIGKSLVDTITPDRYRTAHLAGMAHFLATGEGPVLNQRIELMARHRDGREFPVEVTISPLRVGQTMRFNAFIHDISERKRAQDALQRTASELEGSNKELEMFAYVVSHDLQEPLRAVAGCVQILQRRYEGALDKPADELIKHTVDGARRMQNLIRDLLAYSRVDRRGSPFTAVDCEEALRDAIANLGLALQEKKVSLTHDPLPQLAGDPVQIMQVFQNLVGNAIKYQPVDSRPVIDIKVAREDDHWHFVVSDNGIGIDPQFFDKIFGVFQRLHNRDEYSGTGIGLAICKKIVERHGGRIWVESRLGRGSAFHFTLADKQIDEI